MNILKTPPDQMDYQWQKSEKGLPLIPPKIMGLFRHRGSLTQYLRERRVVPKLLVLEDGPIKFNIELAETLRTKNKIKGLWSRKVAMLIDKEAIVYGHTILENPKNQRKLTDFLSLNEKPLGDWLFSHREITRSDFEFVTYEYTSVARRSVFSIASGQLIVAEFFPPKIFNLFTS
jgi:chorismate-pyruvate lyase